MKKSATLFVMASIMLLYTQCSNPSLDKMTNDDESRGKIISVLVNDRVYMNQVIDSIMYNNRMEMISDTSKHRMMMDMMDKDSVFCSKMGSWMLENPRMKNMMKVKMMQHGYRMDSNIHMK